MADNSTFQLLKSYFIERGGMGICVWEINVVRRMECGEQKECEKYCVNKNQQVQGSYNLFHNTPFL